MRVEIKVNKEKNATISDCFIIENFSDGIDFLKQIELLRDKYNLRFWYYAEVMNSTDLKIEEFAGFLDGEIVFVFFEGLISGSIVSLNETYGYNNFEFKSFDKKINYKSRVDESRLLKQNGGNV